MMPPLPDMAPPLALKVPATVVLLFDQTSMDPPLPLRVAEASTNAPSAMLTSFALIWLSAVFCVVLPMRICPPAVAPVAVVCELEPS